jgi:hypothetical protein
MLDTTTDQTNSSHPPEPLPRLVKPRDEARKLLVNQIKIGQAIRSQRIDYLDDLDQARAEKQEWVTRSSDLLKRLFSDSSVAEQCNNWVGPILPEYAEFDLFVAQFTNEMKHRVGTLQSLVKRLDETAEIESLEAPMIATREPVAPIVAAPTIRWSGLLISHAADETMQQSVTQFLDKLDVSLDTVDSVPGGSAPAHDLVEFALILKGSSQSNDDDVFELGFCVGRFGTQRVCVLHRDPAQSTRGVCHIALDPAGAWQLALARHLKAGGATIDLNRLV